MKTILQQNRKKKKNSNTHLTSVTLDAAIRNLRCFWLLVSYPAKSQNIGCQSVSFLLQTLDLHSEMQNTVLFLEITG